jgi:adenylate cyclase
MVKETNPQASKASPMPPEPSEPSLPGPDGQLRLSEEAVRQQLGKILASPEFQGSALLRAFLLFIVDQTLAGHAEEIKGYTVATQVLGRKADFDAARDPIVRILAGRLRRALERYYWARGGQDPIKIDVPKGAYVPTFQRSTEEKAGVKATSAAAADPALALPPGPSVAVMPLLNLTGDRKQDYFADGLAEELTNELARYQDLRVIAFQSTLGWKGKDLDARKVGRDLNIRFFLEGSIRKDARDIKISVRLVDTSNGLQICGDQYRRELKPHKLIALQEEIARKVAAKIGSEYGIIPRTLSRESRKKPPESLETYDAILRFYHHAMILSPQTFAETLGVLEQAVKRDPESGLAWSLLAFLYGQSYSLQLLPLESPLEQALVAAQRGVILEPENQLVRAALAQVHFFRNERELFLSEAETALALNPNAPALIGFLGWLLALYGEWERGLAIMEKGIQLNPHFPGWFHMAPYFYFYLQDRCEEGYQEALAFQMPHLFWDPLLRAAALGRLGRKPEGARALAELLRLRPDFPTAGRFLIGCFARFPYLIEGLLDGLRRVGLQTR